MRFRVAQCSAALVYCGWALLPASTTANETPLTPVIAMVEDVPDAISLGSQGPETVYRIRLRGVFFKNGVDWSAMCENDIHETVDDCPEKNVAHFTSHNLYQLERRHAVRVGGMLKRESCCSDVGWLDADRIDLLWLTGDRLLKYSPTMVDEPVRRPVAISNQPIEISIKHDNG